jgi:hypothetical protein
VADVAHARALYGTSRFAGTPEDLAIELTEDGYLARGDVEALKERLDTEKVLESLSDTEWITADEVVEATEFAKTTVHRRLASLHGEGRIERTGAGKPHHPFKWKLFVHSQSLVDEQVDESPISLSRAENGEKEKVGQQLELEATTEEFESPAARDADVLELLHQAQLLGEQDQITLLRDDLGPLDCTVWMSRNGYDELERSFLCRGTFADGRSCTFKRQPGRRYCRRHDPDRAGAS